MTTFRAAQVTSPGAPLAVIDQALAEPGPGTVRVAVEACGICHSDSMFVDDQWPGLQFPVTPGHEIAGHIDALGDGVAVWREGDRLVGRLLRPLPQLPARQIHALRGRHGHRRKRLPADTPTTWWRPRARWPAFPTNYQLLTPRRSRAPA